MSDYDASLIQVIPPGDNLYAIIAQIRERPGFYVEEGNLSALYHFINGYMLACFSKGIDEEEFPLFEAFHEFVRERTGFSESTSGWRNMILSVNNHNEADALAMFFALFDEFTRQSTAERPNADESAGTKK